MNQLTVERLTAATLKSWLTKYVGTRCDVPEDQVSGDVPFEDFGIDSVQSIEITAAIEEAFRVQVDPTALFEHYTINRLVEHLASSHNLAAAG